MDKTQEEVMAPRKITAGAERGAPRKTQDAAGDQAGLVALTTTLLAGAVTGAVAGLVEEADARHLRHESAPPLPDELAGRNDRIEPEQERHSLDAPDGAAGAVTALLPAETARAETPQATQADLMPASHTADASHQLPADGDARAPLADPAGLGSVSSIGDVVGSAVQTPVAKMASQPGAAAAFGNGISGGQPDTVSGADAVGAYQTTRPIDDISARLDHAIAGVSEGLAESFAAIDASRADIARTLDGVFETVNANVDAALTQIDGEVSRFADAIDTIGDLVTDALAETPVAAIPASILGAEQDDRQPDGFLARLFDTTAVMPSSEATAAHGHDAAIDTMHSAASSLANSPVFMDEFQISELTSAIDAIKIGFAGQPYTESSEAQDGPGGSHANLLHGLI